MSVCISAEEYCNKETKLALIIDDMGDGTGF